MPIRTFAFPNYYAIVLAVGKDQVFLLAPNLRFLLSKLDPLAIFNYKLSKMLSETHRNTSILKIPLYDTNS